MALTMTLLQADWPVVFTFLFWISRIFPQFFTCPISTLTTLPSSHTKVNISLPGANSQLKIDQNNNKAFCLSYTAHVNQFKWWIHLDLFSSCATKLMLNLLILYLKKKQNKTSHINTLEVDLLRRKSKAIPTCTVHTHNNVYINKYI